MPPPFLPASIDRITDYSAAELEWMMAVDSYKRENGRPFPTLCEMFLIFSRLGYKKVQG